MPRSIRAHYLPLLMLCLPIASIAQSFADLPRSNPFAQPEMLIQKKPAPSNNSDQRAAAVTIVPEIKLTATLISVSEPMVIVNGKMLHIGEEIEGMRLQLVDEGRAVFRFQGKTHEYTIDEDNPGQTR